MLVQFSECNTKVLMQTPRMTAHTKHTFATNSLVEFGKRKASDMNRTDDCPLLNIADGCFDHSDL